MCRGKAARLKRSSQLLDVEVIVRPAAGGYYGFMVAVSAESRRTGRYVCRQYGVRVVLCPRPRTEPVTVRHPSVGGLGDGRRLDSPG
jgi:hypothetical protein